MRPQPIVGLLVVHERLVNGVAEAPEVHFSFLPIIV